MSRPYGGKMENIGEKKVKFNIVVESSERSITFLTDKSKPLVSVSVRTQGTLLIFLCRSRISTSKIRCLMEDSIW